MSRLTIVQKEAIPHMLQGSNVLIQAKTGSGKTLAYAIPIIQQILLQQVRRMRTEQIERKNRVLKLAAGSAFFHFYLFGFLFSSLPLI